MSDPVKDFRRQDPSYDQQASEAVALICACRTIGVADFQQAQVISKQMFSAITEAAPSNATGLLALAMTYLTIQNTAMDSDGLPFFSLKQGAPEVRRELIDKTFCAIARSMRATPKQELST